MSFGACSHRLWQAPGAQDSGDRADPRRDSRGPSSGGRGPANASPNQIVGEVIIDDMVRPLGASILRRVQRGQRRGAGTHPGGEFL